MFKGCASHSFQSAMTSTLTGRNVQLKKDENFHESLYWMDWAMSAVWVLCVWLINAQKPRNIEKAGWDITSPIFALAPECGVQL